MKISCKFIRLLFAGMPQYYFVTTWKLKAQLQQVWAEIEAIENWPNWWKQVIAVEKVKHGDSKGVGGIYRLVFRSALPYLLWFESQVTEVENLKRIHALAYGELQGTGTWIFSAQNGYTTVQYHWNVKTTKWWMNAIAPFARPVFVWNHNYLMQKGGESLAKRLKCDLLQ